MNRLLWVVQVLLALLFLFAGGAKLVMSAAELTAQTPLPAAFLRFIGVMEILGGSAWFYQGRCAFGPRLLPSRPQVSP